jgi:hypothetical protein
MLNDVELFDVNNKLKISLDFLRDAVVLSGKLESHKDGIYKIRLGRNVVTLVDADIEQVDPLEIEGEYKFTLMVDSKKGFAHWMSVLSEQNPTKKDLAKYLNEEKRRYDIQGLSSDIFDYVRSSLEDFAKNSKGCKPYVPMSFVMSVEVLSKVFGKKLTALMNSSPVIQVFILTWLHGYLMSSSVRKQGVKLQTRFEEASEEELKRKETNAKEMMAKFSDELKNMGDDSPFPKMNPEEDDDDDKPAQQA